jgi:hypothetical protein
MTNFSHKLLFYFVFGVATFFLISSCKKKKNEYNFSIPREKLTVILMDIYAAGAVAQMDSTTTNKDSLKQLFFTEICLIHKVKPKELKKIIEELHEMPEINAEIQRKVVDTLSIINFAGGKY